MGCSKRKGCLSCLLLYGVLILQTSRSAQAGLSQGPVVISNSAPMTVKVTGLVELGCITLNSGSVTLGGQSCHMNKLLAVEPEVFTQGVYGQEWVLWRWLVKNSVHYLRSGYSNNKSRFQVLDLSDATGGMCLTLDRSELRVVYGPPFRHHNRHYTDLPGGTSEQRMGDVLSNLACQSDWWMTTVDDMGLVAWNW